MIKTLQRKVIITAMIAITVLLVVLLGALNAVNAWSNRQESGSLLSFLLIMETEGDLPEWMHDQDGNGPPPLPEGESGEQPVPPDNERPRTEGQGAPRGFMTGAVTENDWRAAVYFTLRVKDGMILDTDVSRISTVSDSDARSYGQKALSKGCPGILDTFRYDSADAEDGTRVYVFLDISNRRTAVLRVAALSALAGIIGWGLMLLLVILLSKKAVAPIAANMERQRQFITDAGHELKTPLSIIKANTEAMELLSGPTKWSRNINEQADRLSDLTRNLLTLARADAVPIEGSLQEVDLSALLADTIRMFRESLELRGLNLQTDIDEGLRIRGVQPQLATLFSILLDNAVKYASPDSTVLLSLRTEDKAVRLQLENDCEALPDCPPEQLFDRFYRGDAARTQSGSGGFGIGLAAAQVIVRQHKGRLSAEYVGTNHIVFSVSLPQG